MVSIMAAYSGLLCVHVVYRAGRDCVMSGAVDLVVYGLDRRSSPYTTWIIKWLLHFSVLNKLEKTEIYH